LEEDGLGDIVFCFDGMKGCSAEVKVGYLARTLVPQAFGVFGSNISVYMFHPNISLRVRLLQLQSDTIAYRKQINMSDLQTLEQHLTTRAYVDG